ncbi:hypothetical protein CEUSTIGMA_g7853.t1 [Chlamydomonas eustigma]|uniref:J domain-containing protein n=1 Tax=Chlamydomonas eustigma TaxID=1157962 RepID=A0A250XBH1_9CHLO|nr:hypothetical protein CEUSTIGMA_g7853.t1 [Chlamydomonas eustigma]|eukprot:GAX80414.1 hypothetical protein CEUSTIGMA_g7853.t1 [Chlamydomonas eustigma]
MGRSRSRSRSRDRRRRDSSRDRVHRRSRSRDRSRERSPDRRTEKHRHQDRSREKKKSKHRSLSRDRSLDRGRDNTHREPDRSNKGENNSGTQDAVVVDEKRARLEAWKARQQQLQQQNNTAPVAAVASNNANEEKLWVPWEHSQLPTVKPEPDLKPEAKAWMPWDDPTVAKVVKQEPTTIIAASASHVAAAPPAAVAAPAPRPHLVPAGTGIFCPPPKPVSGHGVANSGLGMTFAAAAKRAAAEAPAAAAPAAAAAAAGIDDDVDPLDAFMAAAVMPEVAEKQAVEAKRREEERAKYAEMIAAGKQPLAEVLEDSESEPEPDMVIQIPTSKVSDDIRTTHVSAMVIQIPTSKVKLLVGAGGLTIGSIQKKSKARVQIKKDEEDLNRAWGTGSSQPVKLPPKLRQQLQKQQAAAARAAKEGRLLQGSTKPAAPPPAAIQLPAAGHNAAGYGIASGFDDNDDVTGSRPAAPSSGTQQEEGDHGGGRENEADDESADDDKPGAPPRKMTTVEIFGDAKAVEIAERMIFEAIDNREQKQKQRQKEYEKKREEKRRARLLYHMRHTKNYEALELTPGASKSEVKKAYRRLAMLWHPDKHPDNQEEAKAKFQVIQKAYDMLMSTDEEEIQMQLT